jgi:hypothetical protein
MPCAVHASLSEPRPRSRTRQIGALRRARNLDREAGGDNAFELHVGLADPYGRVVPVAGPDDGVGVIILRLANEVAKNELPPILMQRRAVFGMPGVTERARTDCLNLLMPEVPYPGKHHGEAGTVGRVDDLAVAH